MNIVTVSSHIADHLMKLKPFPYFNIAHGLLAAVAVREELGAKAQEFSRKHPFALWLSTMLVIFAGSLVANGLLGEPILAPLANNQVLLVATLVWYLVFYAPFDFAYKMLKFLPFNVIVNAMNEIFRAKKIYDGVLHAAQLYPNAWIIIIIIGILKGNGSAFTKLPERLIRGTWTPTALEFMQPSFVSKASLGASVLFLLQLKYANWFAALELLYLGVAIFLVYFKVVAILNGTRTRDPFVKLEQLFCSFFFGSVAAEHAEKKDVSKDEKKEK